MLDYDGLMQPRARAVMLANYNEIARHFGLDPFAMLGRSGLHPSSLSDTENWLPAEPILRLLDESAAMTGRDDFGILMGERRTFASLGPVSVLLRHEATLGDIIAGAIEYRRLINEITNVNLRTYGSSAILEWNLVPGLHSVHGVDLLATLAYRILVDLAGCNWAPDCLHFRQLPPEQVATFRRVFRCPLEFGSTFDGLSFSSDCLALPNAFADPELTVHARRLLDLLPSIRGEDTLTDRVRSTIPFLISDGKAHAAGVAQHLGMPVRTLQRRLTAEGQSFGQLLNESRRELAVRYLAHSNHPITLIAQLTGYSALSSFTRWFISEFGVPPGKWRKRMMARNERHLRAPLMPLSRQHHHEPAEKGPRRAA